jgi:hypothetical protein
MLPSTELGHQKTEHRTGGSQGILMFDAIDTPKHRYINIAIVAIMVWRDCLDWLRARPRRSVVVSDRLPNPQKIGPPHYRPVIPAYENRAALCPGQQRRSDRRRRALCEPEQGCGLAVRHAEAKSVGVLFESDEPVPSKLQCLLDS